MKEGEGISTRGDVMREGEGKVLTRDDVMACKTLKRAMVFVPEWKGNLWVRELTAAERDDYEQSLMSTRRVGKRVDVQPNFRNAKARMAVKATIDTQGNRVFTDKDAEVLGEKSSAALNVLADKIQELSGMTAGDLEDLEKNSLKDPGDDSPST